MESCQIILQIRWYEFGDFAIQLTGYAARLKRTSLRFDMDWCQESSIAIVIDGSVTPAE